MNFSPDSLYLISLEILQKYLINWLPQNLLNSFMSWASLSSEHCNNKLNEHFLSPVTVWVCVTCCSLQLMLHFQIGPVQGTKGVWWLVVQTRKRGAVTVKEISSVYNSEKVALLHVGIGVSGGVLRELFLPLSLQNLQAQSSRGVWWRDSTQTWSCMLPSCGMSCWFQGERCGRL